MQALIEVLLIVIDIYIWLLIAMAILSWLIAFNVINTRNRFVATVIDFLYRITEPALRPLRRIIPTIGGLDIPAYAAPARAVDLSGLPPAFVYVCEFDPLRDEGMIYAQRLVQAGVSTDLHLYPGTFHGSVGLTGAAISREMLSDVKDGLRRVLRVGSVR